ncbi:MAG: CocE/NonD family hydrolase [Deltaproteobacteria bacterium]|nr:CocE/NonD family hydrolase [Deltaproteobacteria bacterium]
MAKSEPTYEVKVTKNILIPTRDGVELAADLILPDAPGPFPTILTYYPYHKDGLMGAAYIVAEPIEFARRGYAHVFLDIRGTGNSDGWQAGLWRGQQWEDGYDAVEWLAQQSWSDGNVGMWGISYGGYSSMNVAAQAPPHLKAIVPIQGDVLTTAWTHPGGVQRCFGPNVWFPMMICMNFLPPMYTDEEGRWLKVWKNHLEKNTDWLSHLYDHPTEDDWTLEGSCFPRMDRIKAATYIMCGWRDLFPEGQFTLFNGLKVPKKLLMGPWKHGMPSWAVPGPNIDDFDEMIRWFDHWLKDTDTGIMDEPPITIWVQEGGQWRYENEWPLARREDKALYLHPEGSLESEEPQGKDASESFDHDATVGAARGLEDPLAMPMGAPIDQRVDDQASLTYTTEPMAEDTEITGAPMVKIFASTSADAGVIAAKLNDLAPDGSSASITYGHVNLEQRETREKISPVTPGEVYELSIKMWDTSYLVKAGHRIRLSIASADFPFIWPTPKPAVNTVYYGQERPSQVVIPFIPEQSPALPAPTLIEVAPPTALPPTVEYAKPYWRIERDPAASTVTVHNGVEEKFILNPTTTMEMLLHVKAVASSLDPAATTATTDVTFNIEGHKLGCLTLKAHTKSTAKTTFSTLNIIVNDLLAVSKRWSNP